MTPFAIAGSLCRQLVVVPPGPSASSGQRSAADPPTTGFQPLTTGLLLCAQLGRSRRPAPPEPWEDDPPVAGLPYTGPPDAGRPDAGLP
jgi:hypothetical protein